jgi:hypothetical protein
VSAFCEDEDDVLMVSGRLEVALRSAEKELSSAKQSADQLARYVVAIWACIIGGC